MEKGKEELSEKPEVVLSESSLERFDIASGCLSDICVPMDSSVEHELNREQLNLCH